MISRFISSKSLLHFTRASFSGGDIRKKFSNEITDADYESQNFVHVKPPTSESLFQLTSVLSKVPIFKHQIFLNILARNLESKEAVVTSDFVVPPRVHENGVFVYQSQNLSTIVRKFRSIEQIVLPGALLGFTYPLFAAMVAVPTYYFLLNAQFYEMSRRLVVRLDILPHLEMVSVQRVGAFGFLYTKLHRIQDLEYVSYKSVQEDENYLWAIGGHSVDRNLIFRDRATKEFLYFDEQGVWDAQGLNHALLN